MPSILADASRLAATARLRERPELLDPVYEELHRAVSAEILPSAVLAIGDSGGAFRTEALGGQRRPITPDTNFFLASLTKPIFATAFMQLVEAGLVALYEPVAKHVPEFAGGGRERVTAWHLLTHTSGVTDVEPSLITRHRPSAALMTRMVIEAPLRFQPGTRWEYCSASFYLLGLIIERVTGTPYPRYLEERVMGPLGMAATFDPRGSERPIVPVEGIGFDNRITRFFVLRYLARTALPGGGLFGNAADVYRFGAAVLSPITRDGRALPLAPETVELMARDQTRGVPGSFDGQDRPVSFGLGWGKPTLMRETGGSPTVISHGGASGGRLWLDPESDLVIVLLANRWAADRQPEMAVIEGTYRAMAAA